MKLKRGAKKLFDFLKNKKAGELISRQEVLGATDWTDVTLRTYISKNKFSHYIVPVNDDMSEFKAVYDGGDLLEDEFGQYFTQKNPAVLILSKDDELEDIDGNIYALDTFIGNGAVGHVWKAKEQKSGEVVALKIANPRQDLIKATAFENVKRRFSREAKNGIGLAHDNIIKIEAYGDYKGFPFLVMPIALSSVGDDIERLSKLPQVMAKEVAISVAKGLVYLHSKKHVHRDVKPDNILVASNRGYVLADLGIVKWSDFSPEVISAGTITNELVQLGSWFYMAPEQLKSPHAATSESDIYAFGVSIYEMLTGSYSTPSDFAAGRIERTKDISDDFFRLILDMTKYDYSERPSSSDVLRKLIAMT